MANRQDASDATQVGCNVRRRGLVLSDWPAVEAALLRYAGTGTNADENNTFGNMLDQGPLAGDLYLEVSERRTKANHAEKIAIAFLEQAREALAQRDVYSESYQYDALGTPFFKNSIKVVRVGAPAGPFLLKFGVTQRDEEQFASSLGVRCALESITVTVPVGPDTTTGLAWRVDLSELATHLQELGIKADAHSVWRAFNAVSVDKYDGSLERSGGRFVAMFDDLSLTLSLPCERFEHDCFGKNTIFTGYRFVDQWIVADRFVAGQRPSWSDGTEPCCLTISLNVSEPCLLPTEAQEAQLIQLADKVVGSFQRP